MLLPRECAKTQYSFFNIETRVWFSCGLDFSIYLIPRGGKARLGMNLLLENIQSFTPGWQLISKEVESSTRLRLIKAQQFFIVVVHWSVSHKCLSLFNIWHRSFFLGGSIATNFQLLFRHFISKSFRLGRHARRPG